MQPGMVEARLRIKETLDARPELVLILDPSGSQSSRLRARFLSQDDDVISVQLGAALGQNLLVSIAGEIESAFGRQSLPGKYRVSSCRIAGIGKYQAELTPELSAEEAAQPSTRADDDPDHYQTLQVSRQADTDTIRRVFHILAQRYHPDNHETGNQEKFRQVVDAHAALCDPEKRAAHDIFLASEDKGRYKIFDSLESTEGVQAEIRKRQGILRLLYAKRLIDTHHPAMRAREFSEMLACPLEHLEFALWMLREQRLITRADNNYFEITSQGVQAFEVEQGDYSKKALIALPAPAQSA